MRQRRRLHNVGSLDSAVFFFFFFPFCLFFGFVKETESDGWRA